MEIDRVRLVKVEGDPWTPDDANIHPRMSDQTHDQFLAGHSDEGVHRMPAAQAMAIVEWTGSGYQIIQADGIAAVYHVDVGRVGIELESHIDMGSPDAWAVMAAPTSLGGGDPIFITEMHDGTTKTGQYVELVIASGNASEPETINRTPIDNGFVVEVFGEPLVQL